MESAHAPAALRVLSRDAEGLAAALTAFLQDAASQTGTLRPCKPARRPRVSRFSRLVWHHAA